MQLTAPIAADGYQCYLGLLPVKMVPEAAQQSIDKACAQANQRLNVGAISKSAVQKAVGLLAQVFAQQAQVIAGRNLLAQQDFIC